MVDMSDPEIEAIGMKEVVWFVIGLVVGGVMASLLMPEGGAVDPFWRRAATLLTGVAFVLVVSRKKFFI